MHYFSEKTLSGGWMADKKDDKPKDPPYLTSAQKTAHDDRLKQYQALHTEDALEERELESDKHKIALQNILHDYMSQYKGKTPQGVPVVHNLKHLKGEERYKHAAALLNKAVLYGLRHLHAGAKPPEKDEDKAKEKAFLDQLEKFYLDNPTMLEQHVHAFTGVDYESLVRGIMKSKNLLSERSVINQIIAKYSESINKKVIKSNELEKYITNDLFKPASMKYVDGTLKKHGKKVRSTIDDTDLVELIRKSAEPEKYKPRKGDEYLDDLPKAA
jgi:hypothetical protein